ncbi:MAG: DUF6527 family protein [Chroococcidiopsis sp.]
MKARTLKLIDGRLLPCEPSEVTHLELHFPLDFAPLKARIIPVQTTGKREGTPNWTWNGSLDAPTLRPSILTSWEGGDPAQKVVCHSYVEDGVVSFLHDSTHDLSGKSRPLLDFDLDDTFDLGILT